MENFKIRRISLAILLLLSLCSPNRSLGKEIKIQNKLNTSKSTQLVIVAPPFKQNPIKKTIFENRSLSNTRGLFLSGITSEGNYLISSFVDEMKTFEVSPNGKVVKKVHEKLPDKYRGAISKYPPLRFVSQGHYFFSINDGFLITNEDWEETKIVDSDSNGFLQIIDGNKLYNREGKLQDTFPFLNNTGQDYDDVVIGRDLIARPLELVDIKNKKEFGKYPLALGFKGLNKLRGNLKYKGYYFTSEKLNLYEDQFLIGIDSGKNIYLGLQRFSGGTSFNNSTIYKLNKDGTVLGKLNFNSELSLHMLHLTPTGEIFVVENNGERIILRKFQFR